MNYKCTYIYFRCILYNCIKLASSQSSPPPCSHLTSSQWFPCESNLTELQTIECMPLQRIILVHDKGQLTGPVPHRFKCRHDNLMPPLFAYTNCFLHYLSCFANRQCTRSLYRYNKTIVSRFNELDVLSQNVMWYFFGMNFMDTV